VLPADHRKGPYLDEVFSAISLPISSLVFPSVEMPRFFAAVISGSLLLCAVLGCVNVADEASFAAFSNSFLARPRDLASSGSFCGPHRKMTRSIATTINHSYPTRANEFHIVRMQAASYKSAERNLPKFSRTRPLRLRNTFKRQRARLGRKLTQRARGGQGRLAAQVSFPLLRSSRRFYLPRYRCSFKYPSSGR